MGKISDLWIRLGLKKDGFDKGIQDVNKKSEGLKGTFSRVKGVAVGVWAAIGASVLKLGKDIVNSTKGMQDSWDMFCAKAKTGWNTFVKSLVNNDGFSQFIKKFKTELQLTEDLQKVLQGDGEILASIRIQKAQIASELAELEVAMLDVNKPLEERIKAAEKYKSLVAPIYDQEIERLKKLKDAQYKAFLGNIWTGEAYKNPTNQRIWDSLFKDYGLQTQFSELGGLTFAEALEKAMKAPSSTRGLTQQARNNSDELIAFKKTFEDWARKRYGVGEDFNILDKFIFPFFDNYVNNRTAEEIDALVGIIEALAQAMGQEQIDLKRIETRLNNLRKQANDLASEPAVEFGAIEDIGFDPIETVPIHFDFSQYDEELDNLVANWKQAYDDIAAINSMIEQSIAQSISGGVQALTDMIAGVEGAGFSNVLGAIVEPIAGMMMQLGEMLISEGIAIEAFKTSLASLNGGVAIAAGAALIATASVLRSGIQALGNTAGASTATTYSGGAASAGVQNIQSEMTIYVEGKISGSDIVLVGNKTIKNWGR